MKKFISLFISLTLALSLFIPCVSANATTFTPTVLMYEDFENAPTTSTDLDAYMKGTNSDWKFQATNLTVDMAGRPQMTIIGTGDKKLSVAGNQPKYSNATSHADLLDTSAVASTGGQQIFYYTFDQAYTAASFPDTKLVISYDITASLQIPAKSVYGTNFLSMSLRNSSASSTYHMNISMPGVFEIGGMSSTMSTEARAEWTDRFEDGGNINVKIVVDPGVNETVYVNDIYYGTSTKALTDIKEFYINPFNMVDLTFDNFIAYTVSDTFDMEDSALAGQTAVAVDAETVFEFNNEIDEASLSAMTITANGSDLTAGTDYTADLAKDTDTGLNTKVKVTFPNNMAYGTNYVVTFPTTFKDASYTALAAPETVSFTTKSLPTFTLSDIAVNSGWGGAGAAVTSLSQIAGGMARFSVTATSTTATEVPSVVVIALYKDGSIVSFGASDKNFATGASDTVSCAMYIPEDTTGYMVKAFVCGSLSDLTAFGEKTFN